MCSILICKAYFVWLLTFQVSTPPSSWLFPLFIPGQTVTVLNGPVLAVDKDVGANAVVKYRLLGDRMNFFTVDSETGNAAPPAASGQQFTAVMQSFFYSSSIKVWYACVRGLRWTARPSKSLALSCIWWRRTSEVWTVAFLSRWPFWTRTTTLQSSARPLSACGSLKTAPLVGDWMLSLRSLSDFMGFLHIFKVQCVKFLRNPIFKEARLKCVLYLGHCHCCP